MEEGWPATARAAHRAPVEHGLGGGLAGLAQQHRSAHRRQRLLALDRAADAAAQIALEIGDEDRLPQGFVEGGGVLHWSVCAGPFRRLCPRSIRAGAGRPKSLTAVVGEL